MSRFLIKRAAMPCGALECAKVEDSPTSPSYVLRDEQGNLIGILTTAPGVTVIESPQSQANESKS